MVDFPVNGYPLVDFMLSKEIGLACTEDTSMIIFGGYALAGILAALLHTDM